MYAVLNPAQEKECDTPPKRVHKKVNKFEVALNFLGAAPQSTKLMWRRKTKNEKKCVRGRSEYVVVKEGWKS
jgi:hypothetical protein